MSELIRQALSSDIELLARTNDTLLSHCGKMLRPMLSLLMGRICGGGGEDGIKYAAAVELLHNATLLHDDVADRSPERRGIPTVNALLGPGAAVLVGDFWLAKTVEMLYGASSRREEVMRLFSQTLVNLAEGEMLQLEKASLADTSREEYFRIIYCKTASLFVTACACAACAADAPAEYVDAARSYGRAAGLAFQIKDDILDYCGDAAMGKPAGMDLHECKITLPLLCALSESDREVEIRNMVRDIPAHPEYRDRVLQFVKENDGVPRAARILDEYIAQAVHSLDLFPVSEARDLLVQMTEFIALRQI